MVSTNPAELAVDRTFSTVSLNLAKAASPNEVVNAIRATPRLREADLYLFQEVRHQEGKPSVADKVARNLGYSVSFAASTGVYDQGLAIVSRYPIFNVQIKHLKACNLRFRCRNRFALAASVRTPWEDLRVWNLHLDTRINPQERLLQLQPVMDDAVCHNGPRLIGGDFNTNDFYWWGNLLPLPWGPRHGSAIRRVMRQYGFESPFPDRLDTWSPFHLHLDWIFLCGLKSIAVGVEAVRFSDHSAIWVRAEM